jgi:tRNA1Val (adenine37-N6)-methyltransferase
MLLGALIKPDVYRTGLDIGTGTGVLSLMVAQKCKDLYVTALDIDDESLLDCAENFMASPWSDRLSCHNTDIQLFSEETTFDLIFTNPPFYKDSLLGSDDRVSRSKHSAHLSFDSLFLKVSRLLSIDGVFWGIFPGEYDNEILELAKENGLFLNDQVRIFGVPGRHIRTVFCFRKEEGEPVFSELIVRDENGYYTDQYIALTKDYHGRELR